ncbi:MAG TPA: hypothetical protein VLL05_01675 [Terriglobales bacterium]|nr:hypothetical protein [Terriglobales bacterium]
MKYIEPPKFGGPEVLRLIEAEMPKPGEGPRERCRKERRETEPEDLPEARRLTLAISRPK